MKRRGLVVARHRRELQIEDESGQRHSSLMRGRKIKPLAGDEVEWKTNSDGTVIVDGILPRRSVLERIDARGRPEGIAANISQIAVVLAPEPAPDWQLVDRYLVAASLANVAAALIANKVDLVEAADDTRLEVYGQIGYPVIATSAHDGQGLDKLAELLDGHRSVLVGQSGVGKSSLLNALLPEPTAAVGELSERRALGRHTTTAAMLYHLPRGGDLIDSPGVR
ncbi:MAG: ribosome small subunit-dependent GTPase A, partial [Gammaproteobacteria bacterium]|nr:ribosome small subunit-dependent GTPase A [Gammaproteobacteria bacterium]